MSNTESRKTDYTEVDLLDVLRPKFSEGKGVITLQSGMTNGQIAFTIRQAVSLSSGRAFTVIPPADPTVPAEDQLSGEKVYFYAAGPVLGEANANPAELNIARGLVAATEEFKRGCSQKGSHGEPWACQSCTEAYLKAVRNLTLL